MLSRSAGAERPDSAGLEVVDVPVPQSESARSPLQPGEPPCKQLCPVRVLVGAVQARSRGGWTPPRRTVRPSTHAKRQEHTGKSESAPCSSYTRAERAVQEVQSSPRMIAVFGVPPPFSSRSARSASARIAGSQVRTGSRSCAGCLSSRLLPTPHSQSTGRCDTQEPRPDGPAAVDTPPTQLPAGYGHLAGTVLLHSLCVQSCRFSRPSVAEKLISIPGMQGSGIPTARVPSFRTLVVQ